MKGFLLLLALLVLGSCIAQLPEDFDEDLFLDEEESSENLAVEEDSFKGDHYDEEIADFTCALSIAAYCPVRKIKHWRCGEPCKKYKVKDIKVIYNKHTQTKLYMGYYPAKNQVFVSFRGSLSIRNFIQDLDWQHVQYPNCRYCKVEKGFYHDYQSVYHDLWVELQQLREKHKGAKLVITGHSLGASLSHLLVGDLIFFGDQDFLWYNFGSPRVGNDAFADWIESNYKKTGWRITHSKDLAPHIPFGEEGEWKHPAQEIYYPHNPKGPYVVCDGSGEDPNCADEHPIGIELNLFPYHLDYMGYHFVKIISRCLLPF